MNKIKSTPFFLALAVSVALSFGVASSPASSPVTAVTSVASDPGGGTDPFPTCPDENGCVAAAELNR